MNLGTSSSEPLGVHFRRVVDAKEPEGWGVTLGGLGALGPSPCVESHNAACSLVPLRIQ